MARLLERKEAEARRLDEALSALARARSLERNRRRWLADLLDGGAVPAEPGRLPAVLSTATLLVHSCENTRERRAIRELLPHLERCSERRMRRGVIRIEPYAFGQRRCRLFGPTRVCEDRAQQQ